MATKRVPEIAKERGMSSKDVLLKLRAAGMDVTAAAAEVDEAAALRALASNGAWTPARPAAPGARPGAAAPRSPAPGAGTARVAPRPGAPGQPRPAEGGRPASPGAGPG